MQLTDTAGGSLSYAWNALGQQTSESSPLGSFGKSYDAAGRLSQLTWPDAFFVNYDYDVTGNVTAIRENGAVSGIGVLAQYSYDNLGRRTAIVRGNGKNTAVGFDTAGRLSGLGHAFADATKDVQWTYGFNASGQLKEVSRDNNAYAWGGHYNVERGYTVNGLNQYSQIAPVGQTPDVPGHDLRGNITAVGGVSYAYNALNQLTSVSSTTQPYNGTLTYDPAGRLAKLIAGSTSLQMMYAGDLLLGEKDGAGTLLRRYVHGPGTDEPIVWYEGAGTGDRRWLHADERGSIVAVSDSAGAVIGINRYDEYGNGQAGNLGRFRYTGQAGFEEIGLLNYKARFYSPGLGRFLQTDPIGYGDGLNWYNYVGSDPINATDPSGLICVTPGGCGGGEFTWYGPSPGSGYAYWWALEQYINRERYVLRERFERFSRDSLDRLKRIGCAMPAIGVGGAIGGYAGAGGGVNGGIAWDPKTGRVGGSFAVEVGLGLGGKGKLVTGRQVTASLGGLDGISGGAGISGNVQAGPFGYSVSHEIVGSNSDKSAKERTQVGAGLGGLGLSGNVNLYAGGGGAVKLYDPGCKK